MSCYDYVFNIIKYCQLRINDVLIYQTYSNIYSSFVYKDIEKAEFAVEYILNTIFENDKKCLENGFVLDVKYGYDIIAMQSTSAVTLIENDMNRDITKINQLYYDVNNVYLQTFCIMF